MTLTDKSLAKLLGYITGFKEQFGIDKSDINAGEVRCVVNHLLHVCHSSAGKFEYLKC